MLFGVVEFDFGLFHCGGAAEEEEEEEAESDFGFMEADISSNKLLKESSAYPRFIKGWARHEGATMLRAKWEPNKRPDDTLSIHRPANTTVLPLNNETNRVKVTELTYL